MILGDFGYNYIGEIGFWLFLGWWILGGGFLIRSYTEWILGLVFLLITIPALNYSALNLRPIRFKTEISARERKGRRYELGQFFKFISILLLIFATIGIVSDIVAQRPFQWPVITVFGGGGLILLFIGIILEKIG